MTRVLTFLSCLLLSNHVFGQLLEHQLMGESPAVLASQARKNGDARRGAILFHQVHIGCVKCHAVDGSSNSLGPDLTKPDESKVTADDYVVTSILNPSTEIRKGFESLTIVTNDGKTLTGLLVSRDDNEIILRDPALKGQRTAIRTNDIEEVVQNTVSIMPKGIVSQVGGRQQFSDLVRYVLEIRDGGVEVARRLQPPPGLITFRLPEYEEHVDHAGLIRSLNDEAAERGAKIYERLCINCHGDRQKPGSLPTALRFAEGKFRNGGDPYSMYKTLTHGFGLMVPQTWMVPKQKYDVVHYIRETYVRQPNKAQFVDVTDPYLAALPTGDTFGPEPVEYAPWSDMNYGPSMINTFEVGTDGSNFAYKGIAVRLDSGPGGISQGNNWVVFDHDTLRFAAAWTRSPNSKDSGFINWQGIHFDGRHNAHPRIAGDVQFQNPTGPGWADPASGLFDDKQRVEGRDGRKYGPLPREWAKYRGLHTLGDQTFVEYTVDGTPVLERFEHLDVTVGNRSIGVFVRNMSLGGRTRSQTALVATLNHPAETRNIGPKSIVMLPTGAQSSEVKEMTFDDGSYLQIDDASEFDMTGKDFSIVARLKTKDNGTIFSKTADDGPWVPNAKTLFLRDGRLSYDIGWVGVVQSKKRVNNGRWHDVALTWNSKSGKVRLYIDGKEDNSGTLRPKEPVRQHVARIGFSANNFPEPSNFTGLIDYVSFFPHELSAAEVATVTSAKAALDAGASAAWDVTQTPTNDEIADLTAGKRIARWLHGSDAILERAVAAGVTGDHKGVRLVDSTLQMQMTIPEGEPQRNIALWTASVDADLNDDELRTLAAAVEERLDVEDLFARVQLSSRARWPEIVATRPIIGPENGPFAIDALTTPIANPWFARIRLTGHDFYDDGDRVAVCSWDGDVWLVTGLRSLTPNRQLAVDSPSAAAAIQPTTDSDPQPKLTWQRIASGLFQPLGLKIVAGDIYVSCRDQLVILRDRNSDGETDFYECFNNDHQVTEHFHEFAMGLQRDEIGNFYYAKSARHALKAIVPHHGTLLRIPSDGSRTEILANGFRAANGVCLNPDGSFIVTDQEGHWNPKNRINWVHEGGFYGNMFGYHDVTDESDDAMQQPLCWITNTFDRSPAELMWIDNEAWGPLNGTLLNLSYGYGKVYVVPHENVGGQMQGGMCELPIAQFPTGIARGRISPHDNGLYLTGMFAWGSSQQAQEGGFYRLRYTGQESNMPIGLNAAATNLTIQFTDALDGPSASDPKNYAVKVWSLQRTAGYGSKHFDEHEIAVTAAQLSDDGKSVTLTIPELAPTWCMEIKCRLKSATGESFERVIHNTIHRVE